MEQNRRNHRLLDEFKLRVRKTTPIIVFQMGKVGSSSVYQSLKRKGLFVFHQHTLRRKPLHRGLAEIKDQGYLELLKTGLWLLDNVIVPERPVKIITMTRAPIAHLVSSFFENLQRTAGIDNAYRQLSVNDLLQKFNDQLADTNIWLEWYDWEFREVTGINIYDYPFDPLMGYSRIRERNYDILLLRLETPDEVKEKAICEFLDLPDFKLSKANIAENKVYAEAYQEFKQRVQIPEEILNTYYESRYVRHFYSTEEIADYRARWART